MPITINPHLNPGFLTKAHKPTRSINDIGKHEHCCLWCGKMRNCHLDTCGWDERYASLAYHTTLAVYDKAFLEWFTPTGFFKRCYKCREQDARMVWARGTAWRDYLIPSRKVLGATISNLKNAGESSLSSFAAPDHAHVPTAITILVSCPKCLVTNGFMWLCSYLITTIDYPQGRHFYFLKILETMEQMMP